MLVFTNFMWVLCFLIAAMTALNYCRRIDELLSTVEEIEADRDRLSEENRKLDLVSKELKQGLINQMERCRHLEEMIAPLEASKNQLEESEAKLKEEVKVCRKESDRLMNDLEYYAKRISKLSIDKQKLEAELSERETEITGISKAQLPIIPDSIDMQKLDNKPVVNLDSLRAVLVPLAVKADEDAELINKLVELLRPKFKSDVLVNPEFYSQYGRVASGAPGKTTYLQWLSSILSDQFNLEPNNGVEDDEF